MKRSFGPSFGDIFFLVLYVFALALGLAVCGLYGQDLHRAQEVHGYADSKWVFAVVIGALASISSVIYLVPLVLRMTDVVSGLNRGSSLLSAANFFAAVWNFVVFVLWIAVFGVFGKLFIGEDPEGNGGIKRMKRAVWVDLANMLLWLIIASAAFGYWWKHRDPHSRFTGRAHV